MKDSNVKNAREDVSKINNFEMPLERYKEFVEKTNTDLNSVDTILINTAFSLGIESVLEEIAILKMTELEDRRGDIESNSIHSEAWSALHDLNEELYDQLEFNQASVADGNFVLGFLEGYRMMKRIVENGG